MIRILQVVVEMGRGGIQAMLMNYYRHIDRTKIQFDFLIHKVGENNYHEEIASLGGRIFKVSRLNPFSPSYKKEIFQFFREHPEYKVAHFHLDCMSAIPMKQARKAGVPIRIAHSHSSGQDLDWKYPLKMFYKKRIATQATHLAACGIRAGKWMFSCNEFFVLPNAIALANYTYDIERRRDMRRTLNFSQNTIVVGHVGRFSAVKNHNFLIDVMSYLTKEGKDAALLLVGDGECFDDIKERITRQGLEERVIMVGSQSNIVPYLQAMDVFVLPSLYEGLGIVLIEAQTNGLPCLISDRVPKECDVTGRVEQLSLEAPVDVWADKILKLGQMKRVDTYEDVRKARYDICTLAKELEEFYGKLYEGETVV